MHHDTPLITTIVAGLVLAYIFGMIANRIRLPPLVGYLFAGVLVGPNTPGFVADQAVGAELAELGVILLMFGVGLHFSVRDLLSVRAVAIPGALVQIAFATLLGLGLAMLMGWGLGAGLLFGLALSVASTVVLLKALQDRRLIETERGRIAVGWLIVEDLAMVLALVLVPVIAGLYGTETGIHDPFVSFVERIISAPVGIWGVLGLTLVKIAAFAGFMLIVGRRIIPWALHGTAHTGSRELFRLAVLAIALGVALGSSVLFGVSLALGAFFAGMILSGSELSHRAAQETLPLRDAFSVLFFVSVGMLFDPAIIVTDPLPVIATVFIIIVGKSAAAFAIVMLFRRPVSTALTISASLAQIGEFSFILASMGVALAILPAEGQDLILAGALISIVLNPLVFWSLDLMRPRFEARFGQRRDGAGDARIEPIDPSAAALGPITTDMPSEGAIDSGAHGADDDRPEPSRQTNHVVLVGYGQVGRVVADGLQREGKPVVVIEDSDHDVAAARQAGLEVAFGNAASAQVLRLANLEQASTLLVAISNGYEAGTVCESGRKLNPGVRIMARAYSEEEEAYLRGLGADVVIRGEREIGLGLLAWLRGERVDEAAPVPAPVEPIFPPTENQLAKVASEPVAAAAIIIPATIVAETPAEAATETPEEPVVAETASVEEAPAEPVIIEAIEAGSVPEVSPVPAEPEPDSSADDPEASSAVAEAPETGEEVQPPAASESETLVPPDTAPAPDEADPELAAQEDNEVSEGGIAPPAEDAVPADAESTTEIKPELEIEETKPVVPPVVPEPKL
jgi:CPA2 family monovalent cation:H+ antiporter-2